jgi:hypothetical protein
MDTSGGIAVTRWQQSHPVTRMFPDATTALMGQHTEGDPRPPTEGQTSSNIVGIIATTSR